MKKQLAYSLCVIMTITAGTVMAADKLQGKTKATMCAGCHRLSGIGLSDEFPNLAGQKPAYLIKQLTAFKAGTRKNPTMNAMAASLNDADIQNLAAYYASLPTTTTAVIKQEKAIASLPLSTKANVKAFPPTAYVSMKKSASIETLPQQTSWKGGPNMLYDALTPNGKMLLSTSPSTNTVYIFATATGKQLAVIPVGKAPKGVKVTPAGHFAYVSNQGSASISVVDLKRLTVVDTIKVKPGPHNVRFTRDGKHAYVTLQGGAGLGVIDTATRKLIRVIALPGITGPHNLDLSADEKTAFVRDFVHHVAVVDLATGKLKKVITVGNGHGGIDVTPDGHYAITGAIGDDFVSIINTRTLAVTNIKVGNGPHGVRASLDSHWAYVTLTKDNAVAVINLQTMQLEQKIAVGQFPFWVAVQGNP